MQRTKHWSLTPSVLWLSDVVFMYYTSDWQTRSRGCLISWRAGIYILLLIRQIRPPGGASKGLIRPSPLFHDYFVVSNENQWSFLSGALLSLSMHFCNQEPKHLLCTLLARYTYWTIVFGIYDNPIIFVGGCLLLMYPTWLHVGSLVWENMMPSGSIGIEIIS